MNQLFPIFVKLEQLHTLLVGAGPVALEKLHAIISNAPRAKIHIVAERVEEEVWEFVRGKGNIQLENRSFKASDLDGKDLVVLATNNPILNQKVQQLARARHILLNVADKPALCDFYLGSIVQKGNLKIGISTNGKSPTMAKRLKEFLNELLPEELDETLNLMQQLRDDLKGDFQEKIRVLNAHTKDLVSKSSV